MPIKVWESLGKVRPNFDSFIGGNIVIFPISPWIHIPPSLITQIKLFKILGRYSYLNCMHDSQFSTILGDCSNSTVLGTITYLLRGIAHLYVLQSSLKNMYRKYVSK